MNGCENDDTLLPSPLDVERMADLAVDGRLASENGAWVLFRYPARPSRRDWYEFSIALEGATVIFELRDLRGVMTFLGHMEAARRGRRQ